MIAQNFEDFPTVRVMLDDALARGKELLELMGKEHEGFKLNSYRQSIQNFDSVVFCEYVRVNDSTSKIARKHSAQGYLRSCTTSRRRCVSRRLGRIGASK